MNDDVIQDWNLVPAGSQIIFESRLGIIHPRKTDGFIVGKKYTFFLFFTFNHVRIKDTRLYDELYYDVSCGNPPS